MTFDRLVATQLGVLLCAGSLIALLGLQRIMSPLETFIANGIVFAVQIAPLVAIVIAVVRLTPRCAFWAAFVSLIYLFHGILQIFTLDGRIFGVFEVGFALMLFVLGFSLSFQMRTHPGAPGPADASGSSREPPTTPDS
jgi:uncharacterized membrane protein